MGRLVIALTRENGYVITDLTTKQYQQFFTRPHEIFVYEVDLQFNARFHLKYVFPSESDRMVLHCVDYPRRIIAQSRNCLINLIFWDDVGEVDHFELTAQSDELEEMASHLCIIRGFLLIKWSLFLDRTVRKRSRIKINTSLSPRCQNTVTGATSLIAKA